VNSDTGYYMPLADLRGKLFSGPIGNANGPLSTAVWASAVAGVGDVKVSSLIASAGAGLLKDMGKTIVSSTRVFRKVQLVVPPSTLGGAITNVIGTNGVGGLSSTQTSPLMEYYTAYIELGSEGSWNPTPVALFGR